MTLVCGRISARSGRRLFAVYALAAFLAAHLPLLALVPASVVGKNLAEAFPCAQHGCGCRTAAQCWSKCCCFSDRQKLAWANAHRVEPPRALMIAVVRQTVAEQTAEAGCCNRSQRCAGTHTPAADQESTRPEQNRADAEPLGIGVRSLGCQGMTWVGTALPWMMLPVGIPVCVQFVDGGGFRHPESDRCPLPCVFPPVPPPRVEDSLCS